MKAEGTASDAGAAHGEDPVQLGKAKVVADAEADDRVAERSGDDLVARLLVVGLAVGDAADVDVEHVDLAVDREVLAVGADQDRGVEALPSGPRSEMLPASRWMPSSRAQPRAVLRVGPSSGSAPASSSSPPASRFHFSGSATKLGAVGRRGANQPLGGGEVPRLVVCRVELYGRCAQGDPLVLWQSAD